MPWAAAVTRIVLPSRLVGEGGVAVWTFFIGLTSVRETGQKLAYSHMKRHFGKADLWAVP